ncbi:hypothetical protein [Actinokineospora diospyrosa]|uniref:Uncharacterized protein n=1 Tax=Actinokineospora diospyrosa TaxID=103728 RepID=A0ABT1IN41_9PSEU|nr:hypothetical protein [Actinokineospora diospyrosa]MCP2273903.1 hypothetical protein [Actinokineospora diospyrosa]
MHTPTVDVYAKLTTGCPMSYESIAAGETEFTLGGRMSGAVVLTFTDDALRDFLALATAAVGQSTTVQPSVDALAASGYPAE